MTLEAFGKQWRMILRIEPGHVHCHLLDGIEQSFGNPVDDFHHILGFSPLYDGYDGALTAFGGLVSQGGVELAVGQRGFIDTQVCPHVFRKQQPLVGMFPLFPHPVMAQVLLVVTFEPVAIHMVITFKEVGRNRDSIQTLRLKKAAKPTV